MKDDPEALKAEMQKKAEALIPGQYQAGFGMAKGLYSDPRSVKGFVPAGYEGYADKLEAGLDAAAALKKKKDEMQIALITKAIDPLWVKYDTENTGFISKDQNGELAELGMAKAGFK